LRIAIGKRDVESGQIEVYRRDTGEKILLQKEELVDTIVRLLADIQTNLFTKHATFSQEHTFVVDTYEEFKQKIEKGYVLAHRDGSSETAARIQNETKATIRCIPLDESIEEGVDMLTGKRSEKRVIFAKSY
jgi:prolyl-tRNA synthetase